MLTAGNPAPLAAHLSQHKLVLVHAQQHTCVYIVNVVRPFGLTVARHSPRKVADLSYRNICHRVGELKIGRLDVLSCSSYPLSKSVLGLS